MLIPFLAILLWGIYPKKINRDVGENMCIYAKLAMIETSKNKKLSINDQAIEYMQSLKY